MTTSRRLREKIGEILREKILDITDDYRGIKYKEGIQVYLGYPAKLTGRLLALFEKELKKRKKKK